MAQDVLDVLPAAPPPASKRSSFLVLIVLVETEWKPQNLGEIPPDFRVIERLPRRLQLRKGRRFLQEYNSDPGNVDAGRWAILLSGGLKFHDYSQPKHSTPWKPPVSLRRRLVRKIASLFSTRTSKGV